MGVRFAILTVEAGGRKNSGFRRFFEMDVEL